LKLTEFIALLQTHAEGMANTTVTVCVPLASNDNDNDSGSDCLIYDVTDVDFDVDMHGKMFVQIQAE